MVQFSLPQVDKPIGLSSSACGIQDGYVDSNKNALLHQLLAAFSDESRDDQVHALIVFELLNERMGGNAGTDANELSILKALRGEVVHGEQIVSLFDSGSIAVYMPSASESSTLRLARIARSAMQTELPSIDQTKLSCGIALFDPKSIHAEDLINTVHCLARKAGERVGNNIEFLNLILKH